jgi:uncharacterized surface protein with fasciclin (FAS1) repeats
MLDIELPYPIPDSIDSDIDTSESDTDEDDTDTDEDNTDTDRATDVDEDEDVGEEEEDYSIDIENTDEPVPVTTESPTELSNTTDTTEEECQSISQIACSTRSFSMLCSLLEEYALLGDLDDGLWTVFAPTNDAFNNAPPIPDDITNVLLGHTISNELIMFEDLVCTEKTEMTNGKDTRTVCASGKTYQNGRGNDDNQRPEIIDNDTVACNGIIHVVSEVILP